MRPTQPRRDAPLKPLPRFSGLPGHFWAHIRLVSERLGYSVRRGPRGAEAPALRSYAVRDLSDCLEAVGLRSDHVIQPDNGRATDYGRLLADYLNERRDFLTQQVRPSLMTRDEARSEFERLRARLDPKCPLPMNKQKGDKRHHAYPSPVDPDAVWEIKEFYGTTTFGSRVADGVYETMLDGLELRQARNESNRRLRHYLILDDRFTWWDCGRSYLCRVVDLLHMGLVDEVLFGREVLTRWPRIVAEWPER